MATMCIRHYQKCVACGFNQDILELEEERKEANVCIVQDVLCSRAGCTRKELLP